MVVPLGAQAVESLRSSTVLFFVLPLLCFVPCGAVFLGFEAKTFHTTQPCPNLRCPGLGDFVHEPGQKGALVTVK